MKRDECEIVTDTAAYLAAHNIGLDTAETTAAYIATWACGDKKKLWAIVTKADGVARKLEDALGLR
jgi:antirestriction protein ArdC